MWNVYVDGSALSIDNERPPFVGGWAAVVEHGSDGFVVRGREAKTTNTKMELRAAIEGLRAVPHFANVTLWSDCSLLFVIKERMVRKQLPSERNCARDQRLWLEVAAELDTRTVKIRSIPKGGNPIHTRAHKIAKAEARALDRGLPPRAEVVELPSVKERRRWFEKQVANERKLARERQQKKLFHARDCVVGVCVADCQVWLAQGPTYPLVY